MAKEAGDTEITFQGVDSINDFWLYLNGDRSKHFVASGDGTRTCTITWGSSDFIEANVRYGLEDKRLLTMTYQDYGKYERILLVRDHRQTDPPKYNYYICQPLYTAQA